MNVEEDSKVINTDNVEVKNQTIGLSDNDDDISPKIDSEKDNSNTSCEKDELSLKISELQDKYLRKIAEFDNYRKRTLKEKADLILNGGEKTITSILPILDDFERAITNLNKADNIDAVKTGIELIYQKLLKILESEGLKKMETGNATFSTDFHEAIAMIPVDSDDSKGKIIDCVQNGYILNEKVIRHAKVVVGQ